MAASKNKLYNDVLWLTTLDDSRNFWNADILEAIAQTLASRFQELGLSVFQQSFEADGETFSNIIASIGPKEADRIIISAHYDVCGEIDGADVNASGIAGLLELARLLSESESTLNYRIDFAAYCLTEAPYFGTALMGSHHHIEHLKAEKATVHSMLALSGIGYFTDAPHTQEYYTPALTEKHATTGNFIGISCLQNQSDWFSSVYSSIKTHSQLPTEFITYPTNNDNLGISDHRNFLKSGYRAAMIGNGGLNRNPNYHQIPDVIDSLDFERMTQLVQGVYGFLVDVNQ